jgi:hypothetical protein
MDDQNDDTLGRSGTVEDNTQQPAPAPLLSLDQIQAADFESPVRGLGSVNEGVIRQAYWTAYNQAKEGSETRQVMNLMQAMAGIFLKPDNRANVWVPYGSGMGMQTAMPETFRGEQSAVLNALIPHIQHPALRARIADIVWTNDRKQGATAAAAAQAYRDCVTGLLDGVFTPAYDAPARMVGEAIFHLKRMLQILSVTTKKTKRPDWMTEVTQAVYDRALAINDYVTFTEVARLGIGYELFDEKVVAADAEALASRAPAEDYPEAVKRAWSLAAYLNDKLNDEEAANRCRIGAYRCTLSMRRFVLGSAAAEASWVTDALQELRHIRGLEEEEAALEIELRKLQKASLRQMGSIPIEMDLTDDHKVVSEVFEGASLSDALWNFAMLASSQKPDELRREALDMGQQSPLMAMMGYSHVDGEGRTATKTPGASLTGEEPDEGWFDATIDRAEGLRRYQMVAGRIEPARMLLYGTFGIEERHLQPIVGYTPFVPDEQKPLVLLGLVRFFQGDMMSAAHLVIPQLEACLRHILKMAGHDPSKRRDDATEEDLSLSRILDVYRTEVEAILGVSLTDEIDRLYNKRPGPALRHEFAHGQVSAGQCFSHHVIYGVWLVYRICCLFLAPPRWTPIVADAIQRAE